MLTRRNYVFCRFFHGVHTILYAKLKPGYGAVCLKSIHKYLLDYFIVNRLYDIQI